MIDTLYVEEAIASHPRTQRILERFPKARRIHIERYGEVFNRRTQNFRLQKRKPALILAEKHSGHVLPTPPGYGIGGAHNYYFSHMLNCIYDCRYCFLQGMYASANYVLFVNFEDFFSAIDDVLERHHGEPVYFFSGYDCDSLALESISKFVTEALPFFAERPNAWLELRTKSVQLKPLLDTQPISNCVVAFSLTPDDASRALEHKVPPLARRLEVMGRLASQGWPMGLRFDPLIYGEDWERDYGELFEQVFDAVPPETVHSVSYGPLRFPRAMFRDIVKLYPEEQLFASPISTQGPMAAYPTSTENDMAAFCEERLRGFVPESRFFQCTPEAK